MLHPHPFSRSEFEVNQTGPPGFTIEKDVTEIQIEVSQPGPVHGDDGGKDRFEEWPYIPRIRHQAPGGPVPWQPGSNHEIRPAYQGRGGKTKRGEPGIGIPLPVYAFTCIKRNPWVERSDRIFLYLPWIVQADYPQPLTSLDSEDLIIPPFHGGRNQLNGFTESTSYLFLQVATAWSNRGKFAPPSHPTFERSHQD